MGERAERDAVVWRSHALLLFGRVPVPVAACDVYGAVPHTDRSRRGSSRCSRGGGRHARPAARETGVTRNGVTCHPRRLATRPGRGQP